MDEITIKRPPSHYSPVEQAFYFAQQLKSAGYAAAVAVWLRDDANARKTPRQKAKRVRAKRAPRAVGGLVELRDVRTPRGARLWGGRTRWVVEAENVEVTK